MTLQKIALLIGLFFLCFVNFQDIVESLFYAPEKTYTIGLLYDSKKSELKNNISLYESFSMEFLHRSQHKLDFVELLNLDEYNTNIQSLFSEVSPITQIAVIPWKFNYSNIQALVVSLDYALVGSRYQTKVRMFQFDETQEVGFTMYEHLELQGKPLQISYNNDSVHMSVSSKDCLQLVSIMPNLIFKESSMITKHRFSKSTEIVSWDQNINYLAYILNDDPTLLHISEKNQQINMTVRIIQSIFSSQIVFYPLKVSLLESANSTSLIVVLLTLRKSSIALRYVQFNRVQNHWIESKAGVMSQDIGVNPKQFLKTCQSLTPTHFYNPELSLFIIIIRKVYFINLTSSTDKHLSLELPHDYSVSKILSFDAQRRLIFKHTTSNLQANILTLILLNQDYSQRLRQQIGVFQDCYDISVQVRDEEVFLFIASELDCLDVYNLMEHNNPSFLKTSFKKLLATYALYKFSGLRILENYLDVI